MKPILRFCFGVVDFIVEDGMGYFVAICMFHLCLMALAAMGIFWIAVFSTIFGW